MRVVGGRYRLGRLLGKGGMGEVYEAEQVGLGRTVAVKVLPHDAEAAAYARFRREATVLAGLQHPNVVQVIDVGIPTNPTADDPPFLVMEHLVGSTLADVLAATPTLPRERIARIASQIARALAHVHAAHLVHRDVKPANVFLSEISGVGEIAKLLDFGIVRQLGKTALTATGMLVGTPAFIAPEIVSGRPVGPPADVYGLAATMHQAFYGFPPYAGETFEELALQLASPNDPAPPSPPSPEDEAFVSLLFSCLAKESSRRPSAARIAEELERPQRGTSGPPPKGASATPVADRATGYAPTELATPTPKPRPNPVSPPNTGHAPGAPSRPFPLALGVVALVASGAGGAVLMKTLGSSSSASTVPSSSAAPSASTSAATESGPDRASLLDADFRRLVMDDASDLVCAELERTDKSVAIGSEIWCFDAAKRSPRPLRLEGAEAGERTEARSLRALLQLSGGILAAPRDARTLELYRPVLGGGDPSAPSAGGPKATAPLSVEGGKVFEPSTRVDFRCLTSVCMAALSSEATHEARLFRAALPRAGVPSIFSEAKLPATDMPMREVSFGRMYEPFVAAIGRSGKAYIVRTQDPEHPETKEASTRPLRGITDAKRLLAFDYPVVSFSRGPLGSTSGRGYSAILSIEPSEGVADRSWSEGAPIANEPAAADLGTIDYPAAPRVSVDFVITARPSDKIRLEPVAARLRAVSYPDFQTSDVFATERSLCVVHRAKKREGPRFRVTCAGAHSDALVDSEGPLDPKAPREVRFHPQ